MLCRFAGLKLCGPHFKLCICFIDLWASLIVDGYAGLVLWICGSWVVLCRLMSMLALLCTVSYG